MVEVYYNPPYTDGGIEKASKNLAGFEKTKELQPGESQKVTVKFDDDDMASYDYKGAKAYVLEKGDYDISIQSDSHHVIDHKAITVKDTVTYDSDSNTHNGDKTVATNQFDDVAGDVTYLSRADHFANYKEATAAPTNFKMSDKAKETFYNNSNYDPKKFDKDSDKMPTTGAKNGLKLSDMYGKDYGRRRLGQAARPAHLRRYGQPHRQWWLWHPGCEVRRQDPADRCGRPGIAE